MTALSYTNPNVQHLRRLLGRRSLRHGDRQFVVEGPLPAAEAVAAGWTCLAQYVPEGSGTAVSGAGPVSELAVGVLERVGSTKSPQAPLVLVEMRSTDMVEVLNAASFVLVLDRLTDPGNLGTILRSAEAAGADAVVLTPGSADAYNPKTVRASAGALFHVPVLLAGVDDVAATGLRTIGTSSHDGEGRTVVPHTEADLSGRIAIVLGNEAAGLPAEWTDDDGPIDAWIGIRQHGRSESVNVAMASTVLAFEVARRT